MPFTRSQVHMASSCSAVDKRRWKLSGHSCTRKDGLMREIKFRAWNGKHMDYDYRDASLWNGLLVAEGDTILMESTGLLDHHDKPIYEGDIVEYIDNTSKGLVKKITTITDIRHLPDFSCSKWEEIIGNIYEN